MATPVILGLAFGLFFVQACSTVEQTEAPDEDLNTYEQLDAELNRLNDQIADNPGSEELYIKKSNLLFEIAKTLSPSGRQPVYQNLKDHSDSALSHSEMNQETIKEILVNAWSHEQSKGVQLLQQGRTADIVAHFNNAITLIPDSLVTYNLKATTLYEKGNLNEAIKTLEKAGRISGETQTELEEKLAYLYLESGDVERSIEMYQNLVEANPDDHHLKHGLVNAYIIDNQHENAISILTDLTDQFPSRHAYQEALATQVYFLFDKKSDDLLQHDDLDVEFTNEVEQIHQMANQVHSIFDELQATMPINEENTYRIAGFYKEAYLKLSQIIKKIELEDELAEIISDQKEQYLDLSLPLWERLAELNPDNMDYLNHLRQVYLYLDMEEDAQSLERTLSF